VPPRAAQTASRQLAQGRVLKVVDDLDLLPVFEQEQAWGLLTCLDIHDCHPETIRDSQALTRYAIELCRLLKVTAFGPPQVVRFGRGQVEGYSLVQLIETSLISGHFAEATNRAFIDIFSCAYYDPRQAARFSLEFFGGRQYSIHSVLRK